jgi:hypothetical protein
MGYNYMGEIMSIQRMLQPIANKIVGNAIHVVTPKKQMSPAFKIARGVIRRGPRTMSSATRKGLLFVSDPIIKGYFVFDGDDILGYIRQPSDIKKMAVPRKMKRKIWRHLTSKIKDYSSKSKITHPKKQWSRRLGIAIAGTGAVGVGAATGAKVGHKRGYSKGYETALNDVLRYSKSATSNMFNIMEQLQKSGMSLMDLKKMSIDDLNKQLGRLGLKAGKDYLKHRRLAPRVVEGIEISEKARKAH